MLRKDILDFLNTLPKEVTLVAATKYVDASTLIELKRNGINNLGENRVDNFLEKYEKLKDEKDIVWHFIGHLQRNKAKEIINKIDYLHSLDSLKLAELIDKYRAKPLDVFIEVSINLEENKNGVPYYEIEEFINNIKNYKNIHIVGLMMMAYKNSDNPYEEFKKLKDLKEELERKCHITLPYLSMGMSDDYKEAIEAGATHIRLGRILFDL